MSAVGVHTTPASSTPSGSKLTPSFLLDTLQRECERHDASDFLLPSGPTLITRADVDKAKSDVSRCLDQLRSTQLAHTTDLAQLATFTVPQLKAALQERGAPFNASAKSELFDELTTLIDDDQAKALLPVQQLLSNASKLFETLNRTMAVETQRLVTYAAICSSFTAVLDDFYKLRLLGTDRLGPTSVDVSLHDVHATLQRLAVSAVHYDTPAVFARLGKISREHAITDAYNDLPQVFGALIGAFMQFRTELRLDSKLLSFVTPSVILEYAFKALPSGMDGFALRSLLESAAPLGPYADDYASSAKALRNWLEGVIPRLEAMAKSLNPRVVKALVAPKVPAQATPRGATASFIVRDASADDLSVLAKKHANDPPEGPCPCHRQSRHALYCCLAFTDAYVSSVHGDKQDKAFMLKVKASAPLLDKQRARILVLQASPEPRAAGSKIA